MDFATGSEAPTRAFTVLELLTVVVVISILAVMLFPIIGSLRERGEKVKCISNLRSLHIAANTYIQAKGNWPQIGSALMATDNKEYARLWIAALAPFGITEQVWVCPTVQRLSGAPDLKDPQHRRVDYIATPFDDKQFTPFKWAAQPWFAERGSHGDGNLVIFADGSVKSLGDIVRAENAGGGLSGPDKHAHKLPEMVAIAATADANEGGPEGSFSVTRTGKTDSAVTVTYSITGTATNGVDYAAIEKEVTIPAGSNIAKIHIVAAKDAERENAETVIITLLSSSGGYKIAEPRTATVTIHDPDDGS